MSDTIRQELELEALNNILRSDPGMTVGRAQRIMDLSRKHGVGIGLEIIAHEDTWQQSKMRDMLSPAIESQLSAREMDDCEADASRALLSDLAPLTYLANSDGVEYWEERQMSDRAATFWGAVVVAINVAAAVFLLGQHFGWWRR